MAKEDGNFIGNHSAGYMAQTQTNPMAVPLVKNFYKENESVTKRSDKDNQEFMDTNHIKVTGADIPRAVMTFEESGLSKHILAKLNEKFDKPSPIQS